MENGTSSSRRLAKNIGLLIISNFGSKILNFLLVPLYTSVLTTAEYGTYDIYATTASLLLPILTCNIVDAVLRFSLDGKKKKEDVFSIGVKFCIRAIFVYGLAILIAWKLNLIRNIIEYPILLLLYFVFFTFYELIIRFVRGLDRVPDIAVGGVINTFSLVVFNILFLLVLKMGLIGYFYAVYLSYLLPIVYYIVHIKLWKYASLKKNISCEKEMINYSLPLVFDATAWWINNASDRYIVTWMCGVAVNGVYSVAYKIPSVINTVQSIFNQAWLISVVNEFENENYVFLNKTYRIYNVFLVMTCSVLILLDKFIAHILFAKEFYAAWAFAPFLMVSVVFGALSSFIEGVFAAAKSTRILATTTVTGAVINLSMNIILVNIYGAIGAAFSTMLSYFVVWLLRVINLRKITSIKLVSWKDSISFGLLTIHAISVSVFDINYIYSIVIFAAIVILNSIEIKNIMKKLYLVARSKLYS